MLSECLGSCWLEELKINVVIEKWCDLKKTVGDKRSIYLKRAPGVAKKSL